MRNVTATMNTSGKFEFGREELGPVIAQYLQDLAQTCAYFSAERNAKILFAARAGVRIREALSVYLGRIGEDVPEDWEIFWVSRLMIAKGVWNDAPDESAALFDHEFRYTPAEIALSCLRGTSERSLVPPQAWPSVASGSNVGALLRQGCSDTTDTIMHFREQSVLFRTETDRLVGERKRALIVDTGWAATSQRLLMKGRPDIDWWGCYFGLWNESGDIHPHWSKAIALVFRSATVDPRHPETSIIAHRHLIESLFEPIAPSIESYKRNADGSILALGSQENLADADAHPRDPIFSGVLDYLATAPEDPAQTRANASRAWRLIFRRLLMPSRETAMLFTDQERGADFGRGLVVPVLLPRDEHSTADQRIERSLWRPGQIALEYEPGMAINIQRRLYNLPFDGNPVALPQSKAIATRAKVAVITRTMERPTFLRRALYSVHAQEFKDYIHIVVCDGGDAQLVSRIIEEAMIDHSKVVLIDNIENRGMEAASNIAIRATDSEYIVIHDDDDSWQDDFLDEMVTFLDSAKGRKYGGAICRSLHVSESIDAEGIQIHGVWIYRDVRKAPSLEEMRTGNSFPPIAFLFRREVYDQLDGFNEAYPVLGDWDFNVRFLEMKDIGFVNKELANYHHRDVGDTASFGNTVVAGIDKHLEYDVIVKNALARRRSRANSEQS